jgi:hypothetical protein
MMNKKNLPHIITVTSFVVFIVLGLACATTPPQWEGVIYNGEDSKLLEGTVWCFETDHTFYNKKRVEFHPDGKLAARDWGKASWERVGTDIKMVLDNGSLYIEGKYDSDRIEINGTLFSSGGNKWNFSMELDGSIADAQRIARLDTALYGTWIGRGEVIDRTYYTFLAGNYGLYFREKESPPIEKGTYTADDRGTITIEVTHVYDGTEKIFLSKDEFTARYKGRGYTDAQINAEINKYHPERTYKYFFQDDPGFVAIMGRWLVLDGRNSQLAYTKLYYSYR